ncbi:MAG: MFS transporter [Leptospiraceae bacterium]
MAAVSERFHSFLTDDELRSCERIPDEFCQEVPGNFAANILNGTITKLAERIIHPGLTLPWILSALGVSTFWIGLLVPVRDAGSLLPQIFVSARIRSMAIRKSVWVLAASVQGLCLLACGFAILYLKTRWAGVSILLLFLLYSVASGIASLAFKDVTAKTIPSGQRGSLLSYRALFGGMLSIPAGLGLLFYVRGEESTTVFTWLFWIAAGLWWVSALIYSRIKEFPGATRGGRNPIDELRAGMAVLRQDSNFRRFLAVRALLFSIPLMLPYVVLGMASNEPGSMGWLILVGGIAELISSPFWGRHADRSAAGLIQVCSIIALIVILAAMLMPHFLDEKYLFFGSLALIFIHSIAYSGARLGRKTYLVDYAPEDNRSTYISVANTFMGCFTLLAASFAFVAQFLGTQIQLLFFALLLCICLILANRLEPLRARS